MLRDCCCSATAVWRVLLLGESCYVANAAARRLLFSTDAVLGRYSATVARLAAWRLESHVLHPESGTIDHAIDERWSAAFTFSARS